MLNTDAQALGDYVLRAHPTPDQLRSWQSTVFAETLRLSSAFENENFSRAANSDLLRLAGLIDEHHFQGQLLPLARREGFSVSWSSRMTKTAGKTVTTWSRSQRDRRSFEIVISSTLLFQTFRDVDRKVTVTGRPCANRLEALQRVMEHELTHLLEMVVWNDSSCSKRRFQGIARRFFAHTAFQHDLITQAERAARKYNIRVGQPVRFHVDGVWHMGVVNRITRRATVLVPHAGGQLFSDGCRYHRFYVPLEMLSPVT